ncbi:MAG: hypothetical protein Kow0031_16400 [Anaerolineae bacterium]
MIGCLLLRQPVDPARLLPVLADFSPAVEPAGPAFFLDLGRLAADRPADLLDQLQQAVGPHLPQPPGLGLAVGRFPAQIAAASLGPGRGLVIAPGCEAGFLRPLPVGLLPLDEALARQFHLLGLATLGQLADLPAAAVLNRFGRAGRWLQQLARGQDDRPVRSLSTPPLETISQSFEPPLTSHLALESALRELLALLAGRLRAAYRVCRAVRFDLTLADGALLRETVSLRQPAQQVSPLLMAVQARLTRLDFSAGVSGLTLTLTGLAPSGGLQPSLFGPPPANPLHAHLPELLARFGPERFYAVELAAPEAHLPEQRFRLRPLETE